MRKNSNFCTHVHSFVILEETKMWYLEYFNYCAIGFKPTVVSNFILRSLLVLPIHIKNKYVMLHLK